MSAYREKAVRALILILVQGATAGWLPGAGADPLEEFVDALAGEAVASGAASGLSVGVARGDEILLAKGYGFADLEHKVPATAETVYRIGSITKEFTAAAILLLAEEGKLGLDDPLTKFLPEYPVQGHEVTLRHLLNHTSGIVSLTNLPSFRPRMREEVTHEEMLERFQDLPFEFAPGEKFSYSNSGYYLLGMVVEAAAEAEYADFLEDRFFRPIGLETTYYDRHARIIPNRARGYAGWKGQFSNSTFVSMSQPFAAGALASTVGDLIRWQRALAKGAVLGAESWKEMVTPGKLNNGKLAPYGCGVFVRREKGRKVIRHGGGIKGFRSELTYYPEEEITIAVLSNTESYPPGRVAGRITQYLFAQAQEEEQAGGAEPPNVILINCDNLGYGDLGCYGSKVHRTPAIDRLAAEGVRFTDFYAASPVCTASRAALLTGSYPSRNSMHEFEWDGSVLRPVSPNGLHPDEITLAELLKARGYFTACIGKWHLGDQREFLPPQHGFDLFLGLLYSDEMDDSYTQHNWPPMPLMRNNDVFEAPADLETMTERYTAEAIRIIRAHSQTKNRAQPDRNPRLTNNPVQNASAASHPFFIYLPHMSPGSRQEPIAGKDFQGTSQNGKYGDTIEELDWSTGEILKTLAEEGLDEKTLVIWTADNGAAPPRKATHFGSYGPLAPRVRYDAAEGGLRVPMIARWPGVIPAGKVCSEIATNMDFFPTIAKLAGAAVPADRVIDGEDIWPLLTGEAEALSPHEAFYYYFGGQLQAVRAGKWKLILGLEQPLLQLGMGELGFSVSGRYSRMFGDPVAARLYDLDEDIGEKHDVAEQNPDVVVRLEGFAEKAREELGDLERPVENGRPPGKVEDPVPQLLR